MVVVVTVMVVVVMVVVVVAEEKTKIEGHIYSSLFKLIQISSGLEGLQPAVSRRHPMCNNMTAVITDI